MAVETTIKAYKCENCGQIYRDKYIANVCCKQYHCEVCGCETPQYWLICNTCRDKRDFDKAIKISIGEYEEKFKGNMVCYNDNFYSDVEDMLVTFYDNEFDLPSYCWGTDEMRCELTDNILDNLTEDTYEDAEFDKEAYKEFNEFVTTWNEKYGLRYFTQNNYVVLIPDEVLAKYREEN